MNSFKHISQLRNVYITGNTCILFGNGPSLMDIDLRSLVRYPIFASNAYGLLTSDKLPPPTFYCIADAGYHNELEYKNHENFYKTLFATYPDTVLLASPEIIATAGKYIHIRKCYSIPTIRDKRLLDIGFNPNLLELDGMPGVQSVSQMMIMMAIYMGFSRLYLIGMDHNWLPHYSVSKGDAPHFYLPKADDNVHGVETLGIHQYLIKPRSQSPEQKHPTFYQELISHKVLWEGYYVLKSYADNHNVEILNATPGSLLDVFPRCSLP